MNSGWLCPRCARVWVVALMLLAACVPAKPNAVSLRVIRAACGDFGPATINCWTRRLPKCSEAHDPRALCVVIGAPILPSLRALRIPPGATSQTYTPDLGCGEGERGCNDR
jgi:hypothetical protein